MLGSRISSSFAELKSHEHVANAVTVGINTLPLALYNDDLKSDYLTLKWQPNKIDEIFLCLSFGSISCYCCRSSLLRNSIAVKELSFFPVIFQKTCQEKIKWICHSLRRQKIFSSCLSNSSFSWWKWMHIKTKKSRKPNSTPFLLFRRGSFVVHITFAIRDHLRSSLGIISGLGIICCRGSLVLVGVSFSQISPGFF